MKAILFDLDGTILDTRDVILNSMQNAYIQVLGRETLPTDKELLSLVGIPLKVQMGMLSADKGDELYDAYLEHNKKVQDSMMKGFDGTAETLALLRERGLRLGIVTSKRHEAAQHGLEHMGLADYFELLLGADDTVDHKPEPGPLLDAARLLGLDVKECAYVGDSPYDMRSARSAGMFAIGAVWGMFTREVLLEAGAEVLLSHISELPGILE